MATCLVVGANGFIGSHLVDQLVADGHVVTAFDRFSASTPLYASSGVQQFIGDFSNVSDLRAAAQGQQHVFHLLSATSPITSDADPLLDVRVNVAQTIELLQICVQSGVERFSFASTGGAIYGHQEKLVFSETDRTSPVSPYAIGKLSIENYLRYFRVKHGLESVSFRISNPYGTRQHLLRKQGLIPIAANRILEGDPVIRYGDGSMVRDYVFVNDLARMIARTVDRQPEYDIYNLGSGIGFTVNEVLDCMSSTSGIGFRITELPVPSTFVDHVVLDTSRFTGEFGRLELTPLAAGVSAVFEEARQRLIPVQ